MKPRSSLSKLATASMAALLTMTSSLSTQKSKFIFRSFLFDSSTGICRSPSSFQHEPPEEENDGQSSRSSQFFVLRNVPGDGDCIFHAVLSAVFISMGMLHPDAAASHSSTSNMVHQWRNVVANYLSSPEGTLYVTNYPRKRLVRCRDLLQSAANSEGISTEEYLSKLRQPGKLGGLYGGGPELTVLSNILRRPISIYHLALSSSSSQKVSITENSNDDSASLFSDNSTCMIDLVGSFGEGLFKDPCDNLPNSVISNAVFFTMNARTKQQNGTTLLLPQSNVHMTKNENESIPAVLMSSALSSPYKSSWHLHILVADASEKEKHACVLLPSASLLHKK